MRSGLRETNSLHPNTADKLLNTSSWLVEDHMHLSHHHVDNGVINI